MKLKSDVKHSGNRRIDSETWRSNEAQDRTGVENVNGVVWFRKCKSIFKAERVWKKSTISTITADFSLSLLLLFSEKHGGACILPNNMPTSLLSFRTMWLSQMTRFSKVALIAQLKSTHQKVSGCTNDLLVTVHKTGIFQWMYGYK